MFSKCLIANRGAISLRIGRTLKRLGVGSVAVYSEADVDSLHVRRADEAVLLGPAPAAESYLLGDRIIEEALRLGAGAIHPGYGFLSENAGFAEACEAAGIVFMGPTPAQMRAFALKHTAREIAGNCGVPLLPGTGLLTNVATAAVEAKRIGYPIMLKSTAGGGGIGMKVCWNEFELGEAFATVQRMGRNNFKDAGVFLEKYVASARHIEVQIFGDGQGRIVALGERDCSAQRRNQKVIEETPAIGLSEERRAELMAASIRLGQAVSYRSAGTVEFVLDVETGAFYFLEVNTRLQVEHGVTEEVCGIDLVEWMVRLAQGDTAFLDSYEHRPEGHSIQVRIYAEDATKNFQPSCGLLTEVMVDAAARCETWVERGTEITPYYDPMIAKIIVHGADRPSALAEMRRILEHSAYGGIETNLDYLRMIVATPVFASGRMLTRSLSELTYSPRAVDVLEPGALTTVQDFPGRVGYWNVGVPPSGPMDSLAHRVANRLLGNPTDAATLEIVMSGPTLQFLHGTQIALCGADFQAELDGAKVPLWQSITVAAGAKLRLRTVVGAGTRAYLAIRGGYDVPFYLGSRSTFTLGKFGGHGGRALRAGDVLHFFDGTADAKLIWPRPPTYTNAWEIGVLYGPHGAPDFFTKEDMEMFFATDWKVHYNSNPTGVRLVGPKPSFAREDGGEAGLHPSNIHDNAYAIGAIDFTGDMPIILGPDGPSLGGFVCPATIVSAELWKMGQLKAGDTVRFIPVSHEEAIALELKQDEAIEQLTSLPELASEKTPELASPVLYHVQAGEDQIEIRYRLSGDKNLLVEYGPLILDLRLRFRVHALMTWLEAHPEPGIIDLTPGIRSLQIHYESRELSLKMLLSLLQKAEAALPPTDQIEVPSRVVHLPLSWDDPATRVAIEKYMQSVRADAPWCPSNIEFIRRINGLASIEEVREIVFNASYLVLGLGDVYLGAPVATPLDPRHRLVTTKYNPARTWTPENAVGIGGAYMCVYGMEGPGGYQFVGRTVQMWNAWHATADFADKKPWLLRFFDQVRFYPVTAEELLQQRADFLVGRFQLKVEEQTFRLHDYTRFLEAEAGSIADFRQKQRTAFAEERDRWAAAGQNMVASEPEAEILQEEFSLPLGGYAIASHLAGSVWEVVAVEGQTVKAGDKLVILESMKMETAITAPFTGKIHQILVQKGRTVAAGQDLLILLEDRTATAE